MLADALHITKVSVSKALNNLPGVSDDLRDRILDAARRMGYVRVSRAGAANIRHLGFIEPKKYFLESGDFFTQVYYHLLQRCTSKKIQLHLYVIGEDDEKDLVLPFPFDSRPVDGIFLGGEFSTAYLEALRAYNIAAIAIGFYEIHNDIDAVIVDDYYNSNQIANALIDQGHQNIGFLGDFKYAHTSLDRYYGYVKALKENGLEYREEWVIPDIDEHGRLITDYQLPEKLPTAFMCHSDFAAYHLMLKLKKRGLEVSENVALSTFDNTERTRGSGAKIGLDATGAKCAETALKQMLWRCENPGQEHQRIIINAPLVLH